MSKNKIKQEKAITLIALVVSIIVLLILAGVSIAVLTGENGILNRASEAKQTHEEKTEEEKLKLGVLALSTEYRSQTTHSSDEDKFSKFVNKEANKTKLANELGVSASAIEIDTAKDILTYRTKQYKLDSYGGIADYTPVKITLTLVKDEDNDGKKSVGDEVKVGEEHFYILLKDGTTMTLLSKYNLATSVDSTTQKYYQQNANYETTATRFSNENYWLTQWNAGNKTINLNNWEENYNSGIVYSGETVANNAILRARQYAIDVFGSSVGAKGRLLTNEEANTSNQSNITNCLFGTGKVSTTVLYGIWEDEAEKVESDGCLSYWLASSDEWFSNGVWYVYGRRSLVSNAGDYDRSDFCGVRPVIEVPESAIQ